MNSKWLTFISPEGPEDLELLLEPNANEASITYQEAIYEQGIPTSTFGVDDIQATYSRLSKLGVQFKSEPVDVGTAKIVVFDDTCGDLMQLHEVL